MSGKLRLGDRLLKQVDVLVDATLMHDGIAE
jgi:hypothetical protein